MTNEELVIKIQRGDDSKITELWDQIQKYVSRCAAEYNAGDLTEDLVQEGFFGMLEAVRKYDSTKGNKFLAYAGYYIRNSMQRFLYKAMPGLRLPEHMAVKVQRLNRFTVDFIQKHGREPTDDEIKVLLQMPDVRQVKKAALHPTSLDKPIDEEGTALGDLHAVDEDASDQVIDAVFQEQLRRELWGTVDELPDEIRTAVFEYYKNGKTAREIAESLNIPVERVRQALAKAMRYLRSKKGLRVYYNDLYGNAMAGCGVWNFLNTWTSSTEREALRLIRKKDGIREI